MKQFTYKTKDKSLVYTFQFIQKTNLVQSHLGKIYPKHTQCLMFCNGLFQEAFTIRKHEKDKDVPYFAFRRVMEGVLATIDYKWLRMEIRKKFMARLDKDFDK